MQLSVRHCVGALTLLWGCAGNLGEAEQAATDVHPQIATESDISDSVVGSPAAQISPGVSAACAAGTTRAPASGLRIREIALYQSVKVPLFQNGAWVASRPVMVVQNKRALVRVFVDTVAGYRQRPLRGALTVQNGGTSTELVSERNLAGASTDQAADSTFTFDVPAAQIGPSTQISVALTEPSCGAASAAASAETRFPASGLQALGATTTGRLKVVLLPISVNGRVPQLTEKDIAGIRDVLLSYFPVPSVDVSVRSRPLVWSGAVGASDSRSWSSIVNALVRERSTDRPSTDTYYFGLMQPQPTMAAYCARGCIAGMAPQNTRVQTGTQVGLGIYFADSAAMLNRSAEIIVHELGHAHGRGHAPCVTAGGNIAGVDTRFPVAGGNTGIWGWNSRTGALNPPTHKDVMGYCQPNWISAYTYQALAVRSQVVNINRAPFIQLPGAPVRWQHLVAYADGSAQWGGSVELGPPGGDPEPARVLDASGKVIENIEVVRTELSHTEDQLFYIPEPSKDWAKIALSDREITLSDVAAPR